MTLEAVRDDVAEELATRFGGTLRPQVVLEEVATAERELRGQVPADAMSELVHRLAAIRLAELDEAAGSRGSSSGTSAGG
jgi:hypothetical protein